MSLKETGGGETNYLQNLKMKVAAIEELIKKIDVQMEGSFDKKENKRLEAERLKLAKERDKWRAEIERGEERSWCYLPRREVI